MARRLYTSWFSTFARKAALGLELKGLAYEAANDRKRTAKFLKTLSSSNHERARLFWSGDRLEWLFARGFHDWFVNEIKADRVTFP